VDNTCVMSCVFITLLCNNYFPQKFITHKDLESLPHSFPTSPAVVCSGLRFSDLPYPISCRCQSAQTATTVRDEVDIVSWVRRRLVYMPQSSEVPRNEARRTCLELAAAPTARPTSAAAVTSKWRRTERMSHAGTGADTVTLMTCVRPSLDPYHSVDLAASWPRPDTSFIHLCTYTDNETAILTYLLTYL